MTSNDRVTHTDKGKLDEVFGSRFGHLERLGPSTWFLLIGHADGTETAMWFTSRDLPTLIETRERRRLTTTIDRIATAMEARRRELIAKPLASIWPELAKAAVEAMEYGPEREVVNDMTAYVISYALEPYKDGGWRIGSPNQFHERLNAILNEGEGK